MVSTALPQKLLFSLLPVVVSFKPVVSAKCYYHKGNVATDLVECDNLKVPESGINVCCRPGDICMRNNLCLHREAKHDDAYYRGGCTFELWGSADEFCPPMACLQHEGVWDMLPCNKSGTSWYCKEDYPSLDRASDLGTCKGAVALKGGGLTEFFGTAIKPPSTSRTNSTSSSEPEPTGTSGEGDPVRTSSEDSASSSSVPTSTDSPADTRPTETSEDSISTATGPPTAAGPTGTPGIPPSTAPDNSTIAPPPPPPSPDEPRQNNNSIPIGVGVGGGIAVAIAGGLLAFFYIRKRQREAPIRAESPPPLDPNIQKHDSNYYPFAPYLSAAQGSMSSRDGYFRQPKIPNVTESVAAPQENNAYPGQPRYQPPKRTFRHELP